MQVPVIHSLNHFQAGFNSLQKENPSFLSQFTSFLAGIQPGSTAYDFCKWGAIILALVATFGSIVHRLELDIFILRLRRNTPSPHSIPLLSELHEDDDYSDSDDDDGDDETCSSELEDEEDESLGSSNLQGLDVNFGVRGSGHHVDDQLQKATGGLPRRRSIGDIFSLSEIANSKSVVKLWDAIGYRLGLDFHHSGSSAESVVSVYDVDKEQRISPIGAGELPTPATSCASPAVMVSVGENASGNLALEIWDSRLRRRMPAVIAEWGPSMGKTVGVESGDVQKVYVRNDGRYGLTVGDKRNVRSPLANVTEFHADTWWPNGTFLLKI